MLTGGVESYQASLPQYIPSWLPKSYRYVRIIYWVEDLKWWQVWQSWVLIEHVMRVSNVRLRGQHSSNMECSKRGYGAHTRGTFRLGRFRCIFKWWDTRGFSMCWRDVSYNLAWWYPRGFRLGRKVSLNIECGDKGDRARTRGHSGCMTFAAISRGGFRALKGRRDNVTHGIRLVMSPEGHRRASMFRNER